MRSSVGSSTTLLMSGSWVRVPPQSQTKQINIMLNKIIRVLIIVAIIALVINIFPSVYEWCVKGVEWLIAQGKWGIIAIVACVIEALLGGD